MSQPSTGQYPALVAVDFDGVLHRYSYGWRDGSIYDKPVEGAAAAMRRLIDAGFDVAIYSTRAYTRVMDGVTWPGQAQEMAEWLNLHGIPYSRIWLEPGKPPYTILIDDRCVRFRSWRETLSHLEVHSYLDVVEEPRQE